MDILATLYFSALVLINLVTLGAFVFDKLAARGGRRRISERALLTLLLIGGVVGGAIGILMVRHKSQHLSFKLTLVGASILHVGLSLWLLGVGR